MNNFLENMKDEQNKKLTENGATAFESSKDALVDLFAQVGSMRSRPGEIPALFTKAFAEDELLATKIAFYTRNVRGGLGERDAGRIMFKTLAGIRPEVMRKNLKNIVTFGRFDDLFSLYNSSLKEDVLTIVKEQLQADIDSMNKGQAISLLAKWMPSLNTSSKKTRILAKDICEKLGLSKKDYRKTLSSLRSYLNVTEVRMSAKDYDYIKYLEVPSYAMNRYRTAFYRNDEKRFKDYIDSLKKGEVKVNASTLFPYDIVEKYMQGNTYWSGMDYSTQVDDVLEEQWKALPNYVEGENNFLVMADVSGSMSGRPMATSVGLAIYFAERNKGAFSNVFMTFSNKPRLVEVKGKTLCEKIINVSHADWGTNTDLQAAFELVLKTAVKHKTPKEELPTSIVVISDMEIDECTDVKHWGFYDSMKEKFNSHGYEIPNIVFWNVNARHDTFHADANTKGVQLASGQSPSVFKSLVSGIYLTPYEYMVEVLSDPQYDCIVV